MRISSPFLQKLPFLLKIISPFPGHSSLIMGIGTHIKLKHRVSISLVHIQYSTLQREVLTEMLNKICHTAKQYFVSRTLKFVSNFCIYIVIMPCLSFP